MAIKKNNNDWASFYEDDVEVARWLFHLHEGNIHHVQIERNATIQSPGFYIFIAQLISSS
ncbi:tubby C-terminal domain-like protein [Gracilibacillus caseinilyticus]|uniref:tubby C-terminal domain-like protein n=1 Tax=Gracilibacillus caseinilyticus TaxID=2932256 RepID=UPI003F7995C1